jgi:homoserine kinase
MFVKATGPASIGNVGVGFDILGAAVRAEDGPALGDIVTVEDAGKQSFVAVGPFADVLPASPADNLVEAARLALAALPGARVRPATVTLHKGLPVGSGLGSSAASIVAAVLAFDAFYETALDPDGLLAMMGTLEGTVSGSVHYDNVGPAYLGGLQLLLGSDAMARQIPTCPDWRWVLLHPGTSVSTAAARAVMPATYQRATAVDHGRRVAGFVHASHTEEWDLAARLMVDVLAEPFRKSLLPHLAPARAVAMAEGALAAGISGSGPTIFAIADTAEATERIRDRFANELIVNPRGFARICRIPEVGATLEVIP